MKLSGPGSVSDLEGRRLPSRYDCRINDDGLVKAATGVDTQSESKETNQR